MFAESSETLLVLGLQGSRRAASLPLVSRLINVTTTANQHFHYSVQHNGPSCGQKLKDRQIALENGARLESCDDLNIIQTNMNQLHHGRTVPFNSTMCGLCDSVQGTPLSRIVCIQSIPSAFTIGALLISHG